ncbi:MAG: HK97-gp10 family putative phage morphogenesis protein [Pseudomonadota bacterium]
MISVSVSKRSEQVLIDLQHAPRLWEEGVTEALHDIGQIASKEARRLIRQGPKTGRVYVRRGQRHQASAPGQSPAEDTGRLSRSVGYRVRGSRQLAVGAQASYAAFLERGTRKMAPRPFILAAANNTAAQAIGLLGRRVHQRIAA